MNLDALRSLDLCGPDPRPITRAEGLALAETMQRLSKDPVVVQIGAYWGISTAVMMEARPDAFIFSIDKNPCEAEQETLVKLGLDYSRVVRVLGDSVVIGAHWPYTCDLLFIDGDHSYGGVAGDCDMWLPHVRGYVLFHDFIADHPRSDVFKVVYEHFLGGDPFVRVDTLIGFRCG